MESRSPTSAVCLRSKYSIILATIAILGTLAGVYQLWKSAVICRLPSERTALGSEIILQSVTRRADGKVEVEITAESKFRDFKFEQFRVFPGAVDYGVVSNRTIGDRRHIQSTQILDVPVGTTQLRFVQRVYLDKPDRTRSVRLGPLSVLPQPLVHSQDRVSVTIERLLDAREIALATAKEPNRWVPVHRDLRASAAPGARCGVVILVESPVGSNFIDTMVLIDEHGERKMPIMCWKDSTLFPRTSFSGTEELVSIVNKPAAERMLNNRHNKKVAAQQERTERLMLIFDVPESTARVQSFEMRIILPIEPQDSEDVVFHNVPISQSRQ